MGYVDLILRSAQCFSNWPHNWCSTGYHKLPQITLPALLDCFSRVNIKRNSTNVSFQWNPLIFKWFRLVTHTKYPVECQ